MIKGRLSKFGKRVVLADEGTGFFGEYQPNNIDDKRLLTFHGYNLVRIARLWEWEQIYTTNTRLPSTLTQEQLDVALDLAWGMWNGYSIARKAVRTELQRLSILDVNAITSCNCSGKEHYRHYFKATSKMFATPVLMNIYEDELRFGFDQSRWHEGDLVYKIVRDYGWVSDMDNHLLKEVHLQSIYEDPPVHDPEYKASEGFLSPEGLFYPCEYGGHTYLADDLAGFLYRVDDYRSEDLLIAKGWIAIRDSIRVFSTGVRPTPAQVKAMREMVKRNSPDDGIVDGVATAFELWDIPLEETEG